MCSSNGLKVFNTDFPLHKLRRQWPLKVLQREVWQCVYFGTLLEDGRFAFLMQECWGDLRNFIDEAMLLRGIAVGPPFPFYDPHYYRYVFGTCKKGISIMSDIALQMKILHLQGIFHRDLKASNSLFKMDGEFILADFASSALVLGTTFWRAPEILLAVKNSDQPIAFTDKADVYSYGMTCFEIATGRLPFEGELEPSESSFDLVIQGRRPRLSRKLDAGVKKLIRECWHLDPEQRPSFRFVTSAPSCLLIMITVLSGDAASGEGDQGTRMEVVLSID